MRKLLDSATAKNERLTKKSERKQEELGETWRRGRLNIRHPGLDFRLSFLRVTTQNKRWRCRGRFKRHDRKSEHKQSDIFGEGMKLIRKNSLICWSFHSWTFAGRRLLEFTWIITNSWWCTEDMKVTAVTTRWLKHNRANFPLWMLLLSWHGDV